jgi:hypothetical protein
MKMWRGLPELLWTIAGVCLLMIGVVSALAAPIYLAISVVNKVWRNGTTLAIAEPLLLFLFGGICVAASISIRRHLRKLIDARRKMDRGFAVVIPGNPESSASSPVKVRDGI